MILMFMVQFSYGFSKPIDYEGGSVGMAQT